MSSVADIPDDETARADAPMLRLTLWPHRSMSMRGFRQLMMIVSLGFAIPLYSLVGSAAFWFVGAYMLLDWALLYGLVQLNYRAARVREIVSLWPDLLRIERIEPNGRRRVWEANPHWVKVRVLDTRRVPAYLVLSSAGQDVELGAFLTPSERRDLAHELRRQLALAGAAARL